MGGATAIAAMFQCRRAAIEGCTRRCILCWVLSVLLALPGMPMFLVTRGVRERLYMFDAALLIVFGVVSRCSSWVVVAPSYRSLLSF